MPKVMRCVSRLVLFVLVIVVSGVGTAQAQTDPDTVPTRPDQKELRNALSESPGPTRVTPDLVAKSARLYGTDEQVIRTSDDGGGGSGASGAANYWFSLNWNSGHDEVFDNTIWYFYKIEGYDGFFVEVVGTAGTWDVPADPLMHSKIQKYEPYIDAQSSNATKRAVDPAGSVPLNTNVIPFTVSYKPVEGVEGKVTTEIPYAEAYLNPTVLDKWYSVELDTTPFSWAQLYTERAYANRFVSVWNGEPWGIYIGVCGEYALSFAGAVTVIPWGEPRYLACEYADS